MEGGFEVLEDEVRKVIHETVNGAEKKPRLEAGFFRWLFSGPNDATSSGEELFKFLESVDEMLFQLYSSRSSFTWLQDPFDDHALVPIVYGFATVSVAKVLCSWSPLCVASSQTLIGLSALLSLEIDAVETYFEKVFSTEGQQNASELEKKENDSALNSTLNIVEKLIQSFKIFSQSHSNSGNGAAQPSPDNDNRQKIDQIQKNIWMLMRYKIHKRLGNPDKVDLDVDEFVNMLALARYPALVDQRQREKLTSKVLKLLFDDQQLRTLLEGRFMNVQEEELSVESLHLLSLSRDAYYAKLIKGSAINVSVKLIWVPDDEDEHSRLDKESYGKIMWMVMGKVFNGMGGRSDSLTEGSLVYRTALQMREVKRALTNVWEEAKSFRISNEVHMVEISVLDRLSRDGLLPWMHDTDIRRRQLQMCMVFRRSLVFRYAFAAVVGKRYLSERIISANRVQIIEHHRCVSWAEREYMNFAAVVQKEMSVLRDLLQDMETNITGGKERELLEKFKSMLLTTKKYLNKDLTEMAKISLEKGLKMLRRTKSKSAIVSEVISKAESVFPQKEELVDEENFFDAPEFGSIDLNDVIKILDNYLNEKRVLEKQVLFFDYVKLADETRNVRLENVERSTKRTKSMHLAV